MLATNAVANTPLDDWLLRKTVSAAQPTAARVTTYPGVELPEHTVDIADMAGSDKMNSTLDAEIQISRFLRTQIDAKFFGLLFC